MRAVAVVWVMVFWPTVFWWPTLTETQVESSSWCPHDMNDSFASTWDDAELTFLPPKLSCLPEDGEAWVAWRFGLWDLWVVSWPAVMLGLGLLARFGARASGLDLARYLWFLTAPAVWSVWIYVIALPWGSELNDLGESGFLWSLSFTGVFALCTRALFRRDESSEAGGGGFLVEGAQ